MASSHPGWESKQDEESGQGVARGVNSPPARIGMRRALDFYIVEKE
jgi:hypothetical protein